MIAATPAAPAGGTDRFTVIRVVRAAAAGSGVVQLTDAHLSNALAALIAQEVEQASGAITHVDVRNREGMREGVTGISELGGLRLLVAVQNSPMLTTLELDGNGVQNTGAASLIRRQLACNKIKSSADGNVDLSHSWRGLPLPLLLLMCCVSAGC